MKPEKENHPGNKLQTTSAEPLPLHHCWHPFATLLFSPANPRKHWSQANLGAPSSLHSSVTSPPGQNMSIGIINSPERGAGMQNVYSSSHTSSKPGQCTVKGNYLESQNPQNNTCRGCHILGFKLIPKLIPRFRETLWQNLSRYLLFGAQDTILRVRSSNWTQL